MLMLVTVIPVATAGASEPEKTAVGERTFYHGIIGWTRLSKLGHSITVFAINVHYRTMGLGGGETGWYRFQAFRVKNDFTGILTAPIIVGFGSEDKGLIF